MTDKVPDAIVIGAGVIGLSTGICLAEAGRNGAKLPVTQIVAGYYDDVSKNGGQRYDTSSLITRL